MSKREKEVSVLDPQESAPGVPVEDSSFDPEAASTDTVSIHSRTDPSRADFDRLKGERDQLIDRLARLQAEFENARKRSERERLEFRDYAIGNVVEQFLPVVDNFELALKSKGTADQLRHGVELIVKQMEEVLRQLNVNTIPTVGEAFDPRVHEALGSVERDDMPDHHVAEEIRRGYKIRERLLRPAMVKIIHNPKQTAD
jgi:molecular chaperone GrpE